MNNGKTPKNMRKHRDVKLVKTERRRSYLPSEPDYHITKFFTENLLAIEMKKMQILMNKAVYLGLSVLELTNILMHEFWYGYVKAKYEKAKSCCMDTDSFIVYLEIHDIYKDIAEDNTSNYELGRPSPKGINKKVLSSEKIGKYEYLTGGEILHSVQ